MLIAVFGRASSNGHLKGGDYKGFESDGEPDVRVGYRKDIERFNGQGSTGRRSSGKVSNSNAASICVNAPTETYCIDLLFSSLRD